VPGLSTAGSAQVGTASRGAEACGMLTVAPTLVLLLLGSTLGVWPLQPEPQVVSGFSPPTSTWGPGHRGVDLLGRPGQQVHAAEAGRISFAGKIAGRGVVVVDHGPTRTTYEPVSATVHVGDVVAAGAVIGRLGLFGSHCFPRSCLHWGLIEGETYLDPLTLVGSGPVRLLPFDAPPATSRTISTGITDNVAPPPPSGRRAAAYGHAASFRDPAGWS
jgi:murein DD-endopeptidase MepM/ murein hydrolase activator NlpD